MKDKGSLITVVAIAIALLWAVLSVAQEAPLPKVDLGPKPANFDGVRFCKHYGLSVMKDLDFHKGRLYLRRGLTLADVGGSLPDLSEAKFQYRQSPPVPLAAIAAVKSGIATQAQTQKALSLVLRRMGY